MNICRNCGEPATMTWAFCSDSCRTARRKVQQQKDKKRYLREIKKHKDCKFCGTVIGSRVGTFCSDECARNQRLSLAQSARDLKRSKRPPKVIECPECRQLIIPTGNRQKCCTTACQQRNASRERVENDSHFNDRGAAVTNQTGAAFEWIDRTTVYRRDGWACSYCGCAVQRANWRAMDAAEPDHVFALSRGGDHIYENIVTCCRRCNIAKHDDDWSSRLIP